MLQNPILQWLPIPANHRDFFERKRSMAYKPNTEPRYDGDLQVLNNQDLLEQARSFLTPGNSIFPRAIAAEILDRVAEEGYHGGVAEGFDAFMIGVAVRRLVGNYPSGDEKTKDWKVAFLVGLNFNPNTDIVPDQQLLTTN